MGTEKESSNQPLNFSAITPGLGFHPFSDGLPYAPLSKTNTKTQDEPAGKAGSKTPMTGTGAVAAGRPTFANVPIRPLKPASPATAKISVPVATPARTAPTTVVAPQIAPRSPELVVSKNESPAITLGLEPKYGFVYLIKRALAYTVDTIVNVSLCSVGLSLALVKQGLGPELLLAPGIALVTVLFLLLFNWALITAQEIAFGTSFGKRIFGLILRGSASAIFMRSFFFLPSLGFCAGGLLWSVFDRQRRCWHDLAVSIQPNEIAKL